MTIPQARQQVATHPAKDAVTAPVVKENKDADVARKLKLYGVRATFLRLAKFRRGSQLADHPILLRLAASHRSSRPSARARSRQTSRLTRLFFTPRRPRPLT